MRVGSDNIDLLRHAVGCTHQPQLATRGRLPRLTAHQQ